MNVWPVGIVIRDAHGGPRDLSVSIKALSIFASFTKTIVYIEQWTCMRRRGRVRCEDVIGVPEPRARLSHGHSGKDGLCISLSPFTIVAHSSSLSQRLPASLAVHLFGLAQCLLSVTSQRAARLFALCSCCGLAPPASLSFTNLYPSCNYNSLECFLLFVFVLVSPHRTSCTSNLHEGHHIRRSHPSSSSVLYHVRMHLIAHLPLPVHENLLLCSTVL